MVKQRLAAAATTQAIKVMHATRCSNITYLTTQYVSISYNKTTSVRMVYFEIGITLKMKLRQGTLEDVIVEDITPVYII